MNMTFIDKKIRVVVIYTSDIKNTKKANDQRFLDIMSLKFQFEQIFLSDFDGKKMYDDLKYKLDNNLKIEEDDILRLTILSLFQNEDRQKSIENAIELAKRIPKEGDRVLALAGINTATNKFINDENLKKIRRELSMTKLERLYEEERIDYGNKAAKKAANEAAKKITKNLLSMGMDILVIMSATGLTKVEILDIQKELNQESKN